MKALLAKIRAILRDRKARRFWARVISVLASVVVFISTYALILPAITMETVAACGIEAHQHSDGCYEEVLVCGMEESEDHQHTDSCYERVLICGKEAHIHSAECYKEDSTAVAATGGTSVPVIQAGGQSGSPDQADYRDDFQSGFETGFETDSGGTEISGGLDGSGSGNSDGSGALDVSDGSLETSGQDAGSAEAVDEGNSTAAGVDGSSGSGEASGTWATSALTVNENAADGTTNVLPADLAEEELAGGYVPELDALNFDALLTKETGFYYFHPEEGQSVPENSSDITDWKELKKDTTLASTDLVKAYLAYSIPAGALNETNQVARYRLPANIHLTDDQILAINSTENGIAASYVIPGTQTTDDPDNYRKYLGAEAVEGTRTPDKTLREGAMEYVSAVVKAENVYENTLDENGNYVDAAGHIAADQGDYIGQDLIFIFTPYTIQKNQNTYDNNGNPIRAGEKVTGWFAVDFNMDQIDWIEQDTDLDNTTIEKSAEVIFAQADAAAGTKERIETLRLEEQRSALTEDETADEGAETESSETENAAEGVREKNSADGAADEAEAEAADESATADTADPEKEEGIEKSLEDKEKEDEADSKKEDEDGTEDKTVFKDGTLTADGDGYHITLDYTAEAQIPEKASLSVKEITPDTDPEAYAACLQQAAKEMGANLADDSGNDRDNAADTADADHSSNADSAGKGGAPTLDTAASRFFDIEIVVTDEERNAEKIEPKAPVAVNIQLSGTPKAENGAEKDKNDAAQGSSADSAQKADPTVLHFAEEGVEKIESTIDAPASETGAIEQAEDTTAISFEAESFSIYGVVYTVDFHWEVDGKTYEFSIPGGGFVSLEHVVEVLRIVNSDSDGENAGVNDAGNAEEGIESINLNNIPVSEDVRKFVADVASVKFSTPDLVDISRVNKDTTVGRIKKDRGLEVRYSADLTEEQIAEINEQAVESGDWALISVQPFTSEESLTVTMKDGDVFTIRVTDAQIRQTVIDAKGDTWEITVTYDEDAQIPDGAELRVREILPEDEAYTELYEEAARRASDDARNQGIELPVVTSARLFDIEIHGEDGKVEPQAPVHVDIRLAGDKAEYTSVVHFAEKGAEVMAVHDTLAEERSSGQAKEKTDDDQESLSKEVSFEAEAFSVYTVVDVNSANLSSDGPYILVSGIQGDPGADVGYSESWGKDFFTKIVNGMAMTNESRENGLSSIGVHVWTEGTQGFVGGEATQWAFEQGSNGSYYIKDSSGQYLKWSSYTTTNWSGGQDTHYDGMSLTGNRNEATQFSVTRTGDNDGSVYLTFTDQGATWYLHNNQYSGANEWSSRNYMVKQNPSNDEKNSSAYRFKLCKQSNAYHSFAATKVSSKQVTTDKNYVIYHKFEDEAGNEELYALAHDGTFVRVYDGGDRIYWRETDKNIKWNYQSENGHHLFSVDPDTQETVYLNPVASGDGQTMSSTDDYLTLIGKENGEYGTTIERWDQVSYDYAGLHVVKNGNTVQLVPGTRNAGTSDEFLFAVASTMPSWENKEPVPTVDSDSLGIKITMFDYGDPDGNYAAGDKLPEMTAVAGSDAYTPHAAHALVKPYLVEGLPANNSGNAMTGLFDTGGAITNTITNVNHLFLQSYYDENGTFRYRSEDNYAYIPLNGTSGATNDFTVYSQVATPYTTDRQVGHAYYYHGHFMPFNDIDMNNHLSRLLDQYGTQEIPLADGRTYEDVYGIIGTPNYYTGMKMEASFVQPSNGVLENGDDMVFKFTGDDDMWVYIDGILVLDIGGIHEPLSGTINFRTGEVTNPEGSSLAGKKTLYEIFMAVANDPNTPAEVKAKINAIEWNGGTFADFTTHSFGAFYMERGAGASNLDLQFNLKIAKTDEFVVRKELPEGVDERFVNQRFKYQATYIDAAETDDSKKVKPLYPGTKNKNDEEICLSVTFKDRRDPKTGQPITVNVPVDQNGYFYLFPGEAAVFKVANETIEYDIKEVTIDQNLIKQVDINSSKNVAIADDADVPENGKIADAGFAKVTNRGEVVYTNHPQTQNLRITKHLTNDSAPLLEGENPVFEFRVYLESPVIDSQGNVQVDQEGKPVTKLVPYSYGPYYLVKDGEYYTLTGENNAPVRQGTTPVICSTTGRSGSINSIPPEFTIVIPDLAAGTHFYLEERRDNKPKGYEFVKEELTADTYDPEVLYSGNPDAEVIHRILARDEDDDQDFDPSTIGRIKNGKDAESHVYNRKPTIDIPVEKVWQPANNTPDSVSLALVRFKAPDQNQHEYVEGKGAILIHHYADYGNGDEALPGGFRATYTIKKKGTDEVVFSGTGDRTYDVDPGEYTVTATVSNWGNVPTNFSPDASGSTHTVDVTVEPDQSSTAVLKSKYNIVADGTISISHTASYVGGSLSASTELPQGFRATYSIKDNTTGKYVYTNVPAGDYTVAPGTYTVTAQVSSIAAPQNYYYQRTTSDDNVVVTSDQTTPVTLTSSYEYREAPPVNGTIQFSHVSTGLPDTTSLPQGFQANVVIKGATKTIENAVAGTAYDVPPGEYQIYVQEVYNNGTLPDGYFYTDTEPITVEVTSDQLATGTLASTFGQGGYLTIKHESTGINGTSPNMPNGFSARYTITNQTTGKVVQEYAQVNTEYAVPPGEYIIEMAQIYGEGSHQNFNYVSTNTATVTVGSGDRKTATVTSTYERAGGNNTEVSLYCGYYPSEESATLISGPSIATINSDVVLKYHAYKDSNNNTISPKWQLYYWDGYSWQTSGTEQDMPGDQGTIIHLGEESKYSVVIKMNRDDRNKVGASLDLGIGNANNLLSPSKRSFAYSTFTEESFDLMMDKQETDKALGYMFSRVSTLLSFFSPVEVYASEPDPPSGNTTTISATDMSSSELQVLSIPETFVVPNTYTLDTSFGKMLTLTDPWKYTFEDLPEYDKDGNEYYYAIIETEVPADYEVSYSPQMPVKASDIRANMLARAEAEANHQTLPDLITLTATNTTTIVEGDLQVTKTVKLNGVNDSSHGGATLTFYVGLFESGTAENAIADTVKAITVQNGSATGTVIYPGLQVGNRYYVYETDAQGHKLATGQKTNGYFVTVNGGQSDPITVTPVVNVDVENERRTGDLELSKNVTGAGADTTKQFEFTIELTPPAGESLAASYPAEHSGDNTVTTAVITDGKVTGIKLKHGEKYTIKNLPEGTAYKVIEKDYSQIGYSSAVSNGEGTIVRGSTGKVAVTVTNTYEATQVTLKKVDVANLEKSDLTANDLLKGAAFKITKYEDNNFRAKVTDWEANGSVELADVKNGEDYTLNGTFTFTNLPKGFYLIEETVFPDGYIRLESNPRFEIGDDMKVYLLDASGNRIEGNQSEIIRVLPVTATQTDNVMIYGNTPGAALPNSGGPGTGRFYILGALMTALAGVWYVMRRRRV